MRAQRAIYLVGLFLSVLLVACGANKEIRIADQLVDRGRYTEALEIYRRALGEDPDNRKIQARLVETKRLESRRLMSMAATRLENGDHELAFELYADATRYDPTNMDARAGLREARDRWIDEAEELERAGRFEEALGIYKRILREFREDRTSTEAIARIQKERAQRHREAAQSYLGESLPGNALVELLKAQALTPDDPVLAGEVKGAVARLRDSTEFPVCLYHRRGSKFKETLWALYLNGIFEKRGLPIVVTSKPCGETYRAELYGVLSPVQTRSRRVRLTLQVPDGVTTTPNPAYAVLKGKVEEAEARVKALEPPVLEIENRLETLAHDRMRRGSGTATPEEEALRKQLAEARRPYREAMAEYQRLSAQLARLPEVFEKPAFKTVSYPAREVTRTIRVKGSVVLRSPDGEVIGTVRLDDRIVTTDTTHPLLKGTDLRPEIEEDPLTLPSPRELRLRAESEAMEKLRQRLEALFSEHVEQLWRDARRLALEGDVDLATETFLRAYLSKPDEPIDEAIRYILEAKHAISLPLEDVLAPVVLTERSNDVGFP